jgi:hypothetical protein
MTPLLRFLLVNFAGGFVLGLATGCAYVVLSMDASLFVQEPLTAAMVLWGFAATFAVGAVGTGLGMLPYD